MPATRQRPPEEKRKRTPLIMRTKNERTEAFPLLHVISPSSHEMESCLYTTTAAPRHRNNQPDPTYFVKHKLVHFLCKLEVSQFPKARIVNRDSTKTINSFNK